MWKSIRWSVDSAVGKDCIVCHAPNNDKHYSLVHCPRVSLQTHACASPEQLFPESCLHCCWSSAPKTCSGESVVYLPEVSLHGQGRPNTHRQTNAGIWTHCDELSAHPGISCHCHNWSEKPQWSGLVHPNPKTVKTLQAKFQTFEKRLNHGQCHFSSPNAWKMRRHINLAMVSHIGFQNLSG